MTRTLNIAGRLHTIADDGVLISSDELLDERKNKKQNVVNADVDSALADRYTKSEVYTKQEVNNLVSPNQNYVTVAEFTDLPISGATDTIYRVSSWDGSLSTPAVDVTKYSEYAWDDTGYVFLCVKTQIGEVYDISAANSGAKYADLSAALGVDGGNVPSEIRRGGMSVKFVQSSDNKYVQYRLMSDTFNTTLANWQGVDDEPTAGSKNLLESNSIAKLTNGFTQEFNVVSGQNSGSIQVFRTTNLTLGKKIIFLLECNDGVINKYGVRGNSGADIEKDMQYISEYYRFEPNKVYILTMNSSDILTNSSFGCYIKASNAIGNGTAKFHIWCDWWKTTDKVTYDILNEIDNILSQRLTVDEMQISNNKSFNDNSALLYGFLSNVKYYKNKYTEYGYGELGHKIQLLDYNKLDCIRINASFIKTITVKNAPNNLNHYYSMMVVDSSNHLIAYYSGDDILKTVTDFEGATYVYITSRNENSTVPTFAEVILNGVPITDNSFVGMIASNKPLAKKSMWTLWDSLGFNTWQQYFAELTGALFDADLNIKADNPLTVGGTTSYPFDMDGGQARALHLGSYKNVKQIDYIFYENVNDGAMVTKNGVYDANAAGTINDKPFMLSLYKTISPQTFANNAEARTWIENNWSTFLGYFSEQERKAGVVARIPITPYQSTPNGSKITFSSTVVSAGQISFEWMGTTYAISVAIGDSPQDIVNKFLNYSFGAGSTDVDGGNGSLIVFFYQSGYSSAKITNFNGGSTGISATIIDATGAADFCLAFKGETAVEFADISNWGNAMGLTLYSIYKGIVNYLQRTFPKANLYWVMPFSLNPGSQSDKTYRDVNGKLDMDKYKNSHVYKNRQNLFAIQKEVCEYYGVPYIDLFTQAGMGVNNLETYIPYNDVHPRAIGYKRYAEYIAKFMGIG